MNGLKGASPEMQALYQKAMEAHEQLGTMLNSMNGAPSSLPIPTSTVGVGDAGVTATDMVLQRRLMNAEQQETIRESLHTKSLRELLLIFAKQASRRDQGVGLYDWLQAGGAPLGARWNGVDGRGGIAEHVAPDVQKALTTDGASALIRQDLEPILYEVFVKLFPMAGALETEPANGLVHAYDRTTSFGQAQWIGELDTVVDDRGVYERQFTNIGILATRRGVSLKSQFAVLAGGAGFNPERLELTAGMRAMSAGLQTAMLRGNWLDPTGTAVNEIGAYDPDSIDGFRKLLNSAYAVNVDPSAYDPTDFSAGGSLRRAFDSAIQPIVDAGGGQGGLVIYGSTADQIRFDEQQETKERIILTGEPQELTVGERALKVKTVAGVLPFIGIPGGYIGSYLPTSNPFGGSYARDAYVLDLGTMSRPYLGAEGPTVLEIPVGVSGQLSHLFIIFMMTGLKVAIPTFNSKVRIKV